MFSVAIQLYSVRREMAADFEGTLKALAEMGYQGVEFAGLHDKSAAEVKALLNEVFDMLQGIASERGYEGLVRYGDPSVITRLADYLGKEA